MVGYEPAKPAADGRFRRLDVRVMHPDMTVVATKGYYAVPTSPPRDPATTASPLDVAMARTLRREFAAGDAEQQATVRHCLPSAALLIAGASLLAFLTSVPGVSAQTTQQQKPPVTAKPGTQEDQAVKELRRTRFTSDRRRRQVQHSHGCV